jgi:predicted secreted Zn-dependent protease
MKYALRLLFSLVFIGACNALPITAPALTTLTPVAIPNATVVYYDISGSTENGLRDQLDASGPVGYDGYKGDSTTRWYITWHWPTNQDGSCQMDQTAVSYEIKVIFPRWQPTEGVSAQLVARWEQYTAALLEHEKGHVDLVVLNVPKVVEAVKGRQCEAANAVGEMMLAEIRKQEVEYDAATNHGATQGARFP